ncbi:hypothetical protein QAD02_008651 [Eretmocerus hayati]|uniref:Uncharacterized protein n=1 Tax=Eretmocerus hayati TaxID=131215 RepID=A0ACC2N7F6_9HYME|nr:hypothetical protein QAD02_008651 [Eretmocerus hayati]
MILDILCATITVVAVVCIGWYISIRKTFNFWKQKGVQGPQPILFHGNWKDCVYGMLHPAELARKFYNEFSDQKMVGIFINHKPALILRDPELIKTILQTDFDVFPDRGMPLHPKIDPLSRHLFTMEKTLWDPFSRNLSPAFSPSKVKEMIGPMMNVADHLVRHIKGLDDTSNIECIKLMVKFATQVVGSCAFGLEMDEFSGKSTFSLLNLKRKESSQFNFIRRFLREYLPFMYDRCAVFRDDNKIEFYRDMINFIKKSREDAGISKQDYAGLLLQMKENVEKIGDIEFDEELLAAQVYLYFTAGGDSTAIVIANAMYELAKNDQIQRKLREEIRDSKIEDGIYESLKSMKYLDKIFQETLRKYPLRNIHRRSSRPYTFPNTEITIPEGIDVIICHYAVHQDSSLYESPENFDPDRFQENPNEGNGMIFLPFGGGRRYCIGSKVAEMMFKTVIISVIRNFQIRIGSDAVSQKTFSRKTFMEPVSGIHIKFAKIE